VRSSLFKQFNPLKAELNPICHLVALLGPQLIFHISRIRVNCDNTVVINNLQNTVISKDFQIDTVSHISVCIHNKLCILKQIKFSCCQNIRQYAVVYVISSTKSLLHTQ
jgi:hypothetical protein